LRKGRQIGRPFSSHPSFEPEGMGLVAQGEC
jgi:hypothetical protein